MRVVIDSNQVIHGDWFLSGPAFKELLRASGRGQIELIIPQIVFDEITNKYSETVQDLQRSLKKVARENDHLAISLNLEPLDDIRIGEASANYDTEFRKILGRYSVKIKPYPVVSHDVVARRALDRRKPFDVNGHKGYRDTLLWTSVLEAAADSKVTFISSNSVDFAQGKDMNNKLADDLLNDLTVAGYDKDRVTLYPTVAAFVKSWIEPATEIRQQLQDRLDSDEALRNGLEELLASAIEDRLDLNIDLGSEVEGEVIEILPETVHTFHVLQIQDVREFTDSEYLVSIYTEADVDLAVTERRDTGSWRMSPDWLESRSMSRTLGFEFDANYRDEAYVDIQMTYPNSLG